MRVLAVALVAAVLLPVALGASVTPAAQRLPEAIVGGAGAFVNGQGYVVGGRLADGSYVDDILRSTASGGAEVFGALPAGAGERPGRYSGSAVVLDGQIYYFGGATLKQMTVPDGTPGGTTQAYVPTASADILRIDPATGSATILTEKLRQPAFGMSALAYKGKVYLFGGFYFDFSDPHPIARLDTVTVYDPNAASTERVRQLEVKLPYAVQDAAGAILNNRAYIMGGLSDNDNTTNRCPAPEGDYAPACITDQILVWSPDNELTPPRVVGKLPYRVEFVQAPVVNGKAYLVGGLLTDGTASTSIVEVAPTGNIGQVTTRVLLPTLPQGVFGAATVTDGRNVTLYGGRVDFRDDVVLDSIVTVEPGPTAPWAPRNATASPRAGGGVRLSWEPPRYDGETVVSAYRIYRATAGGNATFLGTTPNLAFEDTTVCAGVESLWRVTAVNARGESDTGSVTGFTPSAGPPPAPANVTAFGGNAEAVVRWQPPTGECEVVVSGYKVLRDGIEVANVGPLQLEYRDINNVVNGRVYNYQVRAYNAQGTGPASDAARALPAEVPAAPRSVVASALESSVQLTWSAPDELVSYYLVNRSTSAASEGQTVGNVTTTTFADTTVERGHTYFYTVRAVNVAGRSPPSEIVPASLVRRPGAPTDVAALGLAGDVLVTWQAPADTGDAPASALRYFVSRSGGGVANPIIVKTDIDGLAFHDRNVTPGQAYTYSVTTLNPLSGPASATATATPSAIANERPIAALAAYPSIVAADEPVEIDASNSNDPDGTVREYVFDFGDGTDPTRSSASAVKHSYHENGTYTASVVVKDERGVESAPARVRVVVGDPEPAGVDGRGGIGGPTPTSLPTSRPGEDTPEAPIPGAPVALLLVAAALVAWRRRS